MNKQSVKRRRGEEDDGSAITIHRLSQLPQPILHNILSLLPQKDAVRTSVLSKSWRYLWHGRLNVELYDNCFARKNEFWSFVDKTLQRLHYLDITDEIFEKIISGCPLIENLDLLYCFFLKSIKLRKHRNIKNFACITLKEIIIEIEEPHILESFYIENCCSDWFLRHRNTHFPHLKSLNLNSVQLPETLDNFSSFFPCLNELILDSCPGLKEFRLLSSSIKRLTIRTDRVNPGKRINAFIDTPNILYFEYSGHGFLPSIKFTTTSNEWKSQITLCYEQEYSDNDATSWFLTLNKMLKALSQSHITLSLDPDEYQKLHINDSYGGFYKPVVVEHLKLRECYSSYFDPAILNCFFRIFRPCYIHMDSGVARLNLAEYISKLIPDETGCYFWLQDLEEISTEVGNMEAKEWCCVKGTSLPAALRSQQQIRYRLTWKEQLSKFT
ncbi:hypothetical protein CASFOL_022039 [Castilleja foliolosa]|uniref:F-box domain-containing protein n=1 Tax=Castilleja foliolosa TaxID=1961234 RepID=A0ABD3CYB8_9LAMI